VRRSESAPPEGWSEALARLDRRGFLKVAGGLAAAGLLPAGCGGIPAERAPAGPLEILSPRAYATLNAAAIRLLGPGAAVLIQSGRVDPALRADGWLAATPALGERLGQGLLVLEFGVWPLLAKLRPFTSLLGKDQDVVLADCMTSSFELKCDLFKGIKAVAALAFYGDPASRRLVGYPGPFGGRAGARGIAAAMGDPTEP
jgi:hypothetical protein